jgi:hypothetical protein
LRRGIVLLPRPAPFVPAREPSITQKPAFFDPSLAALQTYLNRAVDASYLPQTIEDDVFDAEDETARSDYAPDKALAALAPDIGTHLAIIQLTDAMQRSALTAEDILKPAALGCVQLTGLADETQALKALAGAILPPGLQIQSSHPTDLRLYTAPKPGASVQQQQKMIEDLTRAVASDLPVLVIVPSGATPPEVLMPLFTYRMCLTAFSAEHAASLIQQRCFGRKPAWKSILARLPSPGHLRSMSPLALATAFRLSHAEGVIAELVRITTPSGRQFALSDLKGYGEVQNTANRLVADLVAFSAGKIRWDDVPRNLLLSGPPGVGKTFIARAVAVSANVPLIIGDAGEWQASGHLCDMLAAMQRSFAEAASKAPCVLVIDEIDQFGTRRGGSDKSATYWNVVISSLLQKLDGFGATPGVVIIGCCNTPEMLDPALRRPGRFDSVLEVPYPDNEALAAILAWHAPELSDADRAGLLPRLAGKTSADIAAAVRLARSHARSEGHSFGAAHLHKILCPQDTRPQKLRYRIAVHECGHALVAIHLGRGPVQRIQLTTRGGHILRSNVDQAYTLPEMEREIAVLLAGRAAELLVLDEASCGAGGPFDSDLGKATRLATRIETRFGLGADGPIWMPADHDLPASPEITQRVKHRLAKAADLAETTLRAHFDDLRRLSRAVCENGVIHSDDLLAMLTPAKTSPPPPNTPTTATN